MLRGAAEAELTIVGGRTLPGVLRAGAGCHPDRELLVFDPLDAPASSFSWAEVLARSQALAAQLAALGVGRGDAVHVHLPNRPEFLFAWFAAAHLGARIVPTNTAASSAELAYIVDHAEARVSLTDAAGMATVRSATGERVLSCDDDLDLTSGGAVEDVAEPGDDLAVMYTSGTTSRPKGVRVTHANYLYAGETVAAGLGLAPEDRFLTVLPLFHANAQYYSTMGTLVSGGTLVLAARFTASGFADVAIRHRASVASLFAAPIRMILAQQARPHWTEHGLRLVAYAQNLTDVEEARWNEVIGAPLLQLYGMTETIGPPVMNPLHGRRSARRDRAAGARLPLPDPRARTARRSTRPACPASCTSRGRLACRSWRGTSRTAAATAATMSDGWLRTGDLVRRDADGLLSFVGRTRDMIKRAGENVAAGEVEEVLIDHPAVLDAAVIGVPDAMRDEKIIAFVVLADGQSADEEELRAWCSSKLARFRVPSHVAIERELPRTPVGKIQKHLLQAAWRER